MTLTQCPGYYPPFHEFHPHLIVVDIYEPRPNMWTNRLAVHKAIDNYLLIHGICVL